MTRARRVESAVDEHGAEHGLERVGEDRRPVGAAALLLAFAQPDFAAQSQSAARRAPARPVDQRRAHARQVTFGKCGKTLVERHADHAVQHRVADEFEPLVVRLP